MAAIPLCTCSSNQDACNSVGAMSISLHCVYAPRAAIPLLVDLHAQHTFI